MPMFFYLPLIIARGLFSVASETAANEADRMRDLRAERPRTQPGFDQPWLGSHPPPRR